MPSRPGPWSIRSSERRGIIASKVFVGNLNFETTRDELVALMADAGEITDVYLPTDRATGRPRGFAFVEFASEEAAEEAISKFDGFELAGRKLRVNQAEDRPPRAPRFSPGGFDAPPFGSRGGGGGGRPPKPKGSRRGRRGKKRSL